MVAWLGPAIGAIGSIAGGLLGRDSGKKQAAQQSHYNLLAAYEQNRMGQENAAKAFERQIQLGDRAAAQALDFHNATRMTPLKLRREAEEAGFNPLTLLGAGGLATPGAAMPGAAGAPMAPTPALASPQLRRSTSMAAAIGNTGRAIGDAVSAALQPAPDPIDVRTKQLENELLEAQIKVANRSLEKQPKKAVPLGPPAVRRVTTSPVERQNRPPLSDDRDYRDEVTKRTLSTPPPVRKQRKPTVPVWLPGGEPWRMHEEHAEAMKIKPFDTVKMGDVAEVMGEQGEIWLAPDAWEEFRKGKPGETTGIQDYIDKVPTKEEVIEKLPNVGTPTGRKPKKDRKPGREARKRGKSRRKNYAIKPGGR